MKELNFLVALDVIEDAVDVIKVARTLADQCKARLTCLTVVQPLSAVYGGLYLAPGLISREDFEEEALKHAHRKLRTLAEQYGVAATDTHTRLGSPASEIRAMATELRCDLIVLGTHSRRGIGRLLGSTANAVLHGIPCDAHLVKLPSE